MPPVALFEGITPSLLPQAGDLNGVATDDRRDSAENVVIVTSRIWRLHRYSKSVMIMAVICSPDSRGVLFGSAVDRF